MQPPPERDAVGFVDNPAWIYLVHVGTQGTADETGVQRRHTIDLMRAEESQISHAYATVIRLVDQGDSRDQTRVTAALFMSDSQVFLVDLIDNLHVAWKEAFHHAD